MTIQTHGIGMFDHIIHYHRRMVRVLRGTDEAQWHMHKLAEYAAVQS
jgi:hypothetical protein